MATSRSIVEELRQGIVEGYYHPRERLIESDIAQRYGVTRAAVRSAIIALAAEGLIEREPNRGARVRDVSIHETIEITEVRLSLQAMCAAHAAESDDDEARTELLSCIEELRRSVALNDQPVYSAVNRRILAIIREMSAHSIATEVIEMLNLRNAPGTFRVVIPERRFESLREFESIVAAIVGRDPVKAHAAVIEHMNAVLTALRAIGTGGRIPGAVVS